MRRSAYSVISLYTGAGGLDLGLEAAGFTTRVAVEFDQDATATLRANREWPLIAADIHSEAATTKSILAAGDLRVGEADLLVGGPPCQPFSKSGYWARGDSKRLADPRATTLEAYLRVLRDAQPKAFLLENVPGLKFKKKSEGLQLLERTIESINRETGSSYSLNVELVNASEHGVPQERQRVFIIGHRSGSEFSFPSPAYADCAEAKDDLLLQLDAYPEPVFTAWDAIGDLESDPDPALRVTGKWADLLPSVPEGQNYLFHTDRGDGLPLFGWRRRYWSFLLKLAKSRPSWTIAADPGPAIGPFHWRNRKLSTRELCRLQTFPERYRILGNRRSVQRQLGNAVPSLLAERLGLEIRTQFFRDEDARRQSLTLLPIRRGTAPDAELALPVHPKYRPLIGCHEPHPGTGRGYGALERLAAPSS